MKNIKWFTCVYNFDIRALSRSELDVTSTSYDTHKGLFMGMTRKLPLSCTGIYKNAILNP